MEAQKRTLRHGQTVHALYLLHSAVTHHASRNGPATSNNNRSGSRLHCGASNEAAVATDSLPAAVFLPASPPRRDIVRSHAGTDLRFTPGGHQKIGACVDQAARTRSCIPSRFEIRRLKFEPRQPISLHRGANSARAAHRRGIAPRLRPSGHVFAASAFR